MNDERNRAYFKETFSEITAPSALVGKVLDMTENKNRIASINKKVVLLIAAAMLILLATGAAWVVSSLYVNISQSDMLEVSEQDVMNLENIEITDLDEESLDYFKSVETDDIVAMLEHSMKENHYEQQRNEEIAAKYGVEYQNKIIYALREYDGCVVESGAFQTPDGVFTYFHSNEEDLISQTRVYFYLFNAITNEYKLDYAIFDNEGSFVASINSDEGWCIAGANVEFFYEYDIHGGGTNFSWTELEREHRIMPDNTTIDFTGEMFDELFDKRRKMNYELNASDDFILKDIYGW